VRNEVFNICGSGLVKIREIMEWNAREVYAAPHSPTVRYEVNTDKISRYTTIPDTRVTLKSFVEKFRAEQ
jgi:hypothetical protein